VDTKVAPVEVTLDAKQGPAAATVRATELVEISTLDLSANKSACAGNESLYYPPLSEVQNAQPGFTARAAYSGPGLDRTWDMTGMASTYVGQFSR